MCYGMGRHEALVEAIRTKRYFDIHGFGEGLTSTDYELFRPEKDIHLRIRLPYDLILVS